MLTDRSNIYADKPCIYSEKVWCSDTSRCADCTVKPENAALLLARDEELRLLIRKYPAAQYLFGKDGFLELDYASGSGVDLTDQTGWTCSLYCGQVIELAEFLKELAELAASNNE